MPLVKVKPLDKFPPGTLEQIQIHGRDYALCRDERAVRCFDGICPHAGGPLGEGNLDGHQIVCPWHGWEFDCETGANDFDPEIVLKSYPVTIADGEIFVDIE